MDHQTKGQKWTDINREDIFFRRTVGHALFDHKNYLRICGKNENRTI
jgi:hypothetical protein